MGLRRLLLSFSEIIIFCLVYALREERIEGQGHTTLVLGVTCVVSSLGKLVAHMGLRVLATRCRRNDWPGLTAQRLAARLHAIRRVGPAPATVVVRAGGGTSDGCRAGRSAC